MWWSKNIIGKKGKEQELSSNDVKDSIEVEGTLENVKDSKQEAEGTSESSNTEGNH